MPSSQSTSSRHCFMALAWPRRALPLVFVCPAASPRLPDAACSHGLPAAARHGSLPGTACSPARPRSRPRRPPVPGAALAALAQPRPPARPRRRLLSPGPQRGLGGARGAPARPVQRAVPPTSSPHPRLAVVALGLASPSRPAPTQCGACAARPQHVHDSFATRQRGLARACSRGARCLGVARRALGV
jgi:hypothetical protein